MLSKRTMAIAGAVAALTGGGVALAARGGDADKSESSILADAAKRLGVSADDLKDALAKAENAQLDQAVKDGKLTQKQADALKRFRERSGHVLGGPFGVGPGGPGFHGPGRHVFFFGPPGFLGDVADELGISRSELFSQLRDGKTLAEIAKAHGKTLDDLKAAARKGLEERLDKAVKDGKLTKDQADDIRTHLSDLIDHLGDFPRPPRGLRLPDGLRPPHARFGFGYGAPEAGAETVPPGPVL